MKKTLLTVACAIAMTGCQNTEKENPAPAIDENLGLHQIGRYVNDENIFDESAAEIVAFDAVSKQAFVVNAQQAKVDVLTLNDLTMPELVTSIDAKAHWEQAGGINSVDVANGILAVAVEHDVKTNAGQIMFFNAQSLEFVSMVEAGALPDNVTFTHDGLHLLVANEGEPNSDYSIDPEGSITIVDVNDPYNPDAKQITFEKFNEDGAIDAGVRIFGNFEPTKLNVTAFNDGDLGELTLNDTSKLSVNDWFTLSSEEGDPLAYQVKSIDGLNVTLTSELDGDSEVEDSGIDGLAVYLMDGKSSVAQDLEPEYIAVSQDDKTAWVSLQENNAIAVIDIANASIKNIFSLGEKDHSLAGNELDASDKDDAVNIKNWPVFGQYMPDSITSFSVDGTQYYALANEGDSREYDAFVEEVSISQLTLDSQAFPQAFELQEDEQLGRLATSLVIADEFKNADGSRKKLVSYGGRSFSILNENGELVFDSGSDIATLTSEKYGTNFNNTNSKNDGDSRSDNKGAEPEAIASGWINNKPYLFVGLERTGGVLMYDVSNPSAPVLIDYQNLRDFDFEIKAEIDNGDKPGHAAGDLGPEGFRFVPHQKSPNGLPLLIVASEVSGTTTIYQLSDI